MNQEERNEIRARHYETSLWWRQDYTGKIIDELLGCHDCGQELPCDAIRLLDAWDERYGSVEEVVKEYKESLSGPEWND